MPKRDHRLLQGKYPNIATTAAAVAAARGIEAHLSGKDGVKSLQSYHHDIDWPAERVQTAHK